MVQMCFFSNIINNKIDPATTKSAENTRTPVEEKHIPRRINGNGINKGLSQLASSKGPFSIPVIESISLRT